jgi:arabinose-5-phosphate isomerase
MDRARILALADRVLRLEAESVLALCPRLDDRFLAAVKALHDCRGRIIVTGMGKSGLIARKIAATLASTGTPAYFLHPAEGVHGDLGMVGREDVVLALSNSGETDEVLAVVPALKRLGIPLVLLTGSLTSALARQADIVLDVAVAEEACPINLAPTSSTTAALAMGDALAMALLDLRGLGPDDYAALHPRGSLGWKSLFKVSDLMHTGESVPMVSEQATMKEAIEEMSGKGLGMTTVVDADGRLTGVVTDGDLRRQQLAHGATLLERRAAECMTRDPKVIGAEELVAPRASSTCTTSCAPRSCEGRPPRLAHSPARPGRRRRTHRRRALLQRLRRRDEALPRPRRLRAGRCAQGRSSGRGALRTRFRGGHSPHGRARCGRGAPGGGRQGLRPRFASGPPRARRARGRGDGRRSSGSGRDAPGGHGAGSGERGGRGQARGPLDCPSSRW